MVRYKKSGLALLLVLGILLTMCVSAPALADEMPVLPMILTGQVVDSKGAAVTAGDVSVLIGDQVVGSGTIVVEGFAAEVTPNRADTGKALTIKVTISGKEYGVKSDPATFIYKEGDYIDNIVLTLDKEVKKSDGGSSTSNREDEDTPPEAPTASPAAGTIISESLSVALITSTSGAKIFYTVDGTNPSSSPTSNEYAEAIILTGDTTIKAVAYKDNLYSPVAEFKYTLTRKTLTDMNGHWAAQTVQGLVDKGIISGYEDGSFRPENKITRAECAAIIVRALALDVECSPCTLSNFTDGDDVQDWAQGPVAAVVEAGLLKGYPGDDGTMTFQPEKKITRAEVAVLLSRVIAQQGGAAVPAGTMSYSDLSKIPAWAVEGIGVVSEKGLVKGYPDGSFMPGNDVTRAEAATMLSRLIETMAPAQ
ncbi:MAG: Cellulosome-anchoring protein precursor [Pelotomaculum sp. PtaB.Bin104]|nr:MAG: Cellulosome-anchoring protein precursor [Pelotomaculum sp. PtaB.Bin104]